MVALNKRNEAQGVKEALDSSTVWCISSFSKSTVCVCVYVEQKCNNWVKRYICSSGAATIYN